MKVKLKHGDSYIEVDSEFNEEMVDCYIIDDKLEDTLEVDLKKIKEACDDSE